MTHALSRFEHTNALRRMAVVRRASTSEIANFDCNLAAQSVVNLSVSAVDRRGSRVFLQYKGSDNLTGSVACR
jgi:hypothetical protein